MTTSRYFPGRRVLVRAPVNPVIGSTGFMRLSLSLHHDNGTQTQHANAKLYTTYNARLVAIDKSQRVATVDVDVECTSG